MSLSRETKLGFRDWLIFLVFGCSVFFHFRGFDRIVGAVLPQAQALSNFDAAAGFPDDDKKLLLFILDFADFSCITCLDSFLDLYRMLPSRFRTEDAWGILAVGNREGDGEEAGNRQVLIAEKKLKGFIRANRIAFPILLDRSRIFEEVAEKGSGVLLFDGAGKIFRRYDFPLTGEQFAEIFAALME